MASFARYTFIWLIFDTSGSYCGSTKQTVVDIIGFIYKNFLVMGGIKIYHKC